MRLSRRWLIGLATALALLVMLPLVGGWLYFDHLFERYQRHADALPRVQGIPESARSQPGVHAYRGYHPSLVPRPADPYPYPVPVGDVGPYQPLYAGPLQYPFLCRSEESGLGQPLVDNQQGLGIPVYRETPEGQRTREVIGYSKDCLLPTRVRYFYNRAGTRQFFPLSQANGDIARIEVNGEELDFVVRVETGTINRFIYLLAALRGPAETLETPNTPDSSYWNRRLIYQFRGGVGIGRRQGRVPSEGVLERRYDQLREGYALAYSSANQTSNHYNLWLAEETALRVKRQFNARYGEDLYTVGIGGSGGALQQYLIAQNTPDLIDAGIALYGYPDMITQTIYAFDCDLLEYYFDITASHNRRWRVWEERRLVEGLNARSGVSSERSLLYDLGMLVQGRWPHLGSGSSECVNGWRGLTPLVNNPHYVHFANRFAPEVVAQVKWTYWDDLRQIYGTDDQGYARQTWDNVGVQYGLQALREGQLSPEEFLHLNAHIGSWKPQAESGQEHYWRLGGVPDLLSFSPWSHHNMRLKAADQPAAPRFSGDLSAMRAAYRSGQVFMGRLPIPIIDLRHYLEEELDMHHLSASFSTRLRLLREGAADNQLIWVAPKPVTPVAEAFAVLDRWVLATLASADRQAKNHRPTDATDRCYGLEGQVLAEGAQVWNGPWNNRAPGTCLRAYPMYLEPRSAAGAPLAGDLFKCQLMPVEAALEQGVYGAQAMRPFLQQLKAVFPEGVCDYSKPDRGRPANLWVAPTASSELSLRLIAPSVVVDKQPAGGARPVATGLSAP